MRFMACVALAAAAALGVRHDHGQIHARAAGVEGLAEASALDGSARSRAVVEALEQAGPAGLALGFEALGDPVAEVRAGGIAYLASRRSRRSVPHLIRLLRDPVPLVRRAAAVALGAIGAPQALPFLRRAMTSDDPGVAEAALRAARRIIRQADAEA